MSTPTQVIARLSERLQANPNDAKAIGAIYRFTLDGDDGGTWLLDLKDQVGISQGDGPADCSITMASSDFVDLFEQRANGQQLFFAGKLRIDGDMQLALQLQSLIDLMR